MFGQTGLLPAALGTSFETGLWMGWRIEWVWGMDNERTGSKKAHQEAVAVL